MKSIVSWCLVLVLLIGSLPLSASGISIAQTGNPDRYDGGEGVLFKGSTYEGRTWPEFVTWSGLPTETNRTNANGFPFNVELWREKRVVVYGEYRDVPENDFKNATLTGLPEGADRTVGVVNQGYYERNGLLGEYRFHGFDASGNKYANIRFPLDVDSGSKAHEKNWVYRIWNPNHPDYRRSWNGVPRIEDASDYNRRAIEGRDDDLDVIRTRQWIQDSLPFDIVRSDHSDKQAHNYAHVQTRPTTLFNGDAMMWHRASDNSLWYQIFTLNTLKDKMPTPVTAEVQVVDAPLYLGENGDVLIRLKVSGKLEDDYLYDGQPVGDVPEDVMRGVYYNREDIAYWHMTLTDTITGAPLQAEGRRTSQNTGEAEFELSLTYDQYKNLLDEETQGLRIDFNASAKVYYHDDFSGIGHANTSETFDLAKTVTELPPVIPPVYWEEQNKEPLIVELEAPNEQLDTERFAIVDNTVLHEGFTRTVTLMGEVLSDEEADLFVSGNYLFPLLGQDKIYTYVITYSDGEDIELDFINFVIVYTTKPSAQFRVSGTFKENRLISATEDLNRVNTPFLRANAHLNVTQFEADNLSGSNSLIKYGTKNTQRLDYIVKDQATLEMRMVVQAEIAPERIHRNDIPSGYHTSAPYTYNLFVLEDYPPAILANIWNWELTREEALLFDYDASSYDEDLIVVSTYKIYYDSNGDGEPNTLIESGNFEDFTEFIPDKLGHYKIVFYAEEAFGQPTLEQFITDDDIRKITVERPFHVDNLAPMTMIYTDIEREFPQVDIMVLTDESIDRDRNNTLASERVNWMNALRQSAVHGNVGIWDLHTYIHSRTVSTAKFTGDAFPLSTTHYASDGWTGTLNRYDWVNNPYAVQVNEGSYVPVTLSKTVSETHYNSGYADYEHRSSGWVTVNTYGSNGLTLLPNSISYSDGEGYSGTLSKGATGESSDSGPPSGGSVGDTYTRYTTWYAIYSGTATKQGTQWQDNWKTYWYDDYTGYYSGTVYKPIKQTYTPNFRIRSEKYLVYFAEGNINHHTDIQTVLNTGDAEVILVARPSARSQLSHLHHIDSSKPLDEIMDEITSFISDRHREAYAQTILVNETFQTNVANYDDENDPLIEHGFQYVHNPNFYDNSMGLEPGAFISYDGSNFTPTTKTHFTRPGKYTIYRMIEDRPVNRPDYGKESNLAAIDVLVHRRPIADFTLDWDYNAHTGRYQTTWVDLSYDLDHQFSDPERGIRDRRIRYRHTNGDNQWIYKIPDNLLHGVYEVAYVVKDIEGAWSEEVVKTFTLSLEPPMRLEGKLRPLDPKFHLNQVPASETLEIYDVISRFYRTHDIHMALLDAEKKKVQDVVFFSHSNNTNFNKKDDIYNWRAHEHILNPALKDGHYMVEVNARAFLWPHTEKTIELPFQVVTPINVKGKVPILLAGETSEISAITNQYAQSVTAILYQGSAYEKTVTMTMAYLAPNGEKHWVFQEGVEAEISEGTYSFDFIAQTASGNLAYDRVDQEVLVLNIQAFQVKGDWQHWRGQTDLYGNKKLIMPHRFLSHENVTFQAVITGNPEEVWIRLSPELEAMHYTDKKGHRHSHRDIFGMTTSFPLQMIQLDDQTWSVSFIIPYADQSMNWQDQRLKSPYVATVYAKKGDILRETQIDDLDLTGNIYDLIYMQPKFH